LEGIFRSDVNPRIFRNMFLGVFTHMALRWLIFGANVEADKMKEINEVIDLLCTAVLTVDAEKLIA
jgi:TetR/AcrR family fatty acid metabolism transcriptional regulator